ncbi:hypothetical protein [Gudongella sp. DL1XJH-153]|uniref:hypothetical protein n=1 Tax=Gudongella sp. DL1XJH-153 TaxID=3409804 RepID=UPI003BB5293B
MKSIILDYCISLVNLYGIVSFGKVADTYNIQNEDNIKIEELRAEVGKNIVYLRDNLVVVENNELIAMEIMMLDDYSKEKEYKDGKPYYIPEKEELLRYADYTYFERTKSYNDLVEFLYGLYKDKSKAEKLANDIRIFLKSVDGIGNLGYFFEENDLMFKDSKDAEQLMELIKGLADNTRMWANNGYTPIEIEKMVGYN